MTYPFGIMPAPFEELKALAVLAADEDGAQAAPSTEQLGRLSEDLGRPPTAGELAKYREAYAEAFARKGQGAFDEPEPEAPLWYSSSTWSTSPSPSTPELDRWLTTKQAGLRLGYKGAAGFAALVKRLGLEPEGRRGNTNMWRLSTVDGLVASKSP